MSRHNPIATPGALLIAACAALAGCSTRTTVSSTGNTPAQFTHVYLTAQEVWFNTSATAGPDDGNWAKFPLTNPATFDLIADSNATLATLVTGLKLAPGTYNQVRFIPVLGDPGTTLTASASTLAASYNAEADFVDSTGTSHLVPLQLLNPEKGLGLQASITIPIGSLGTLGTTTGTTGTATTGTTTTTTTGTTITISVPLNFDGARDLAMFKYPRDTATNTGVILSSHATAFDTTKSGAITGKLTLTNLVGYTAQSSRVDIQVTAETLSADGSHHVVVNSAPVAADGTFKVYPLSTAANATTSSTSSSSSSSSSSSTTGTSYDLVIHGPSIATMIIKNVTVAAGDPATVTPTSVGTLTPRQASTYYTANVTGTTLPAGALVAFYQTLPGTNEVPYVIAEAPIDPFSGTLVLDQALSTATIDSGTYTSSGSTINTTSSTPQEKAGIYKVGAVGPTLFTDGALTVTVSPPATPITVGTTPTTSPTPQTATPAALSVASGATSASITASVTPATAGKYTGGELIVSHDGAVVGTASLDTALKSGGGSVTISGIPGGTSATGFSAIYYLSTITWNAADKAGTPPTRQSFSTPVDLRTGNATGITLTLD